MVTRRAQARSVNTVRTRNHFLTPPPTFFSEISCSCVREEVSESSCVLGPREEESLMIVDMVWGEGVLLEQRGFLLERQETNCKFLEEFGTVAILKSFGVVGEELEYLSLGIFGFLLDWKWGGKFICVGGLRNRGSDSFHHSPCCPTVVFVFAHKWHFNYYRSQMYLFSLTKEPLLLPHDEDYEEGSPRRGEEIMWWLVVIIYVPLNNFF